MRTTKQKTGEKRRQQQRNRVALLEQLEERCLLSTSPPSTIGLYSPATGEFQLRYSNSRGRPDSKFVFQPSASAVLPVAGDFDGDRSDTVGLFDPQQHLFQLKNENAAGGSSSTFAFGDAGVNYQPVVGDWDGDGMDTVGLFRPDTGEFLLRNENSAGAAQVVFAFGPAGTAVKAIAGDWNGDGIDTVGLYEPASRKFHLAAANAAGASEAVFVFGGANALPVVGDWNGDGIDTIGVYDRSKSAFSLRNSNTAGKASLTFSFGAAARGYLPIAGNWTRGAAVPDNGVYTVPGTTGRTVPTTFTWVSRSAASNNEVGLYAVDDRSGRVGNLQPGDPGYAAAALRSASRVVLFKSGETAGATKTVQLHGGSLFALYLIENNTTKTFLAANPADALNKKPLAYFSLPKANPDKFNHFKPIAPNLFGWEDQKGGGDKDFNDVIGRITFSNSTGGGVTPDQTSPTVALTSPAPSLLTNQQVTIAGRALDDRSGIRRVQAHIDSGAFFDVATSGDGSFQFPAGLGLDGSADGQHTVAVRATDGAGNVSLDATRSFTLDTRPPTVTISSPAANLLTNQQVTIAGRVLDERSGVTLVQASLDSGPLFNVPANNDGNFQFSAELPLDGSADGQHTIRTRATDGAGNVSLDVARSFTLDTTPPLLTVDLSTASDSLPLGDHKTDQQRVDLVGQTEAGRTVELLSGGQVVATTTSNNAGSFIFTGIDLLAGANPFTARTTDAAGNVTQLPVNVTREIRQTCLFDPGLTGWTISESGGSPAGQGSVSAQSCSAVLVEGDSFLVALSRALTIPTTPSVLEFSFGNLVFDPTDPEFVNDAFEVALVDAQGISLVPTFLPSRDAFFNVTEGLTPAAGSGVLVSGNRVIVNLTTLPPGAVGTLIFRLANDDSDIRSQVQIDDVKVRAATPGETQQFAAASGNTVGQAAALAATASGESISAIDFSRFSDITASFSDLYFRTSFDDGQDQLFVDLATRNDGTFESSLPLLVSVTNVSDPSVRVRDADGFTPAGAPFFDLSRQLADDELSPGETSSTRSLIFYNPGHVRFTFDLSFYGLLNQSPTFTSQPDEEALVGQTYVYQAQAADPDGDALAFSLLSAPSGMAIEPSTGRISFTPTAADLGTHSVGIRVSDGQGGSAIQNYEVTVDTDVPNRPPVFTSTPVVDANVNTLYRYEPQVLEADGDPLTFALATAPDGMIIDPATGAVTWTPAANQLGENAVQIAVSDSRGGAAEQSFTVAVQQEAGNHAPIIISEPLTRFALPDAQLLGPLPYLSRADSPFDLSGLGTSFFLEDFEDHQLNTPGLSVNSGIPASTFAGGALNDSVDGDDGVIDGSGTRGDDWFGGALRFSFDPTVLGGFPTEAGLVWTDGAENGALITFEAFDANGLSLGKVFGNHGDGGNFGQTAEDRFYGVTNPGGISAISVTNASGGTEVDHVQYGFSANSKYQHQIRALDPDGDLLTYALTTAPAGAAIDSQGLITFSALTGKYPFVVRVTDGRGGIDTQSFDVTVDGNHPPVITSTPITEFSIPPGDSSPASGDVQPTAINLRLPSGQTQTVAVQLNLPSAGSLVPNADVFLLFDDTGSFANTAPAVIAQFQPIIDQLQAALPNVHFGFGVGRFEDYANLTTGPLDRPFLLNQPIITTDQAGFQAAIAGALARQAPGSGGDTPESLIEALFQTATGLGFDGNNDGDTSDTGSAGTIAAQLVANASGDVPAFTSIDDSVGFSFRLLDVAHLPTLPLDTTITRTMNPGSLNDVFQFQGTAGERLFFDSQSVTFPPPAFTARIFAVEHPRWSLFDSQNRLVARDDLANDRELTLPATDSYVLVVENNDTESILNYSFRLTTPETIAVPYTPGTFISGSISEPRERDQYTFTLTTPTRLLFDEIANSFGSVPLTWTLEGPAGTLVKDRNVDPLTPTLVPESSIQLLPAGDYRLTIGGAVDATSDYQFRLSNLADATPIATGSVIHPTFDHFLETKQFRFDGQAGDHISFQDLLGPSDVVAYLVDPFGQVLFRADGFADTTLGVTGTYTLAVETFSPPGSASFIVNTIPPPSAPLPIGVGDVVTGSIDSRTETDTYSFSLASPTHVYFDSLDNGGAGLSVRLTDTQNNAYIDASMESADGRSRNKPFLFLPAGDYKIVVASNPNSPSTGPYSFQMKDVATASVLNYGTPKNGVLSPVIESDIFTLSGTQGDQVSFNLQSPSFDFFRLLSPTGEILAATTFNHPVTVTLPLTGTYRVLVEGNGGPDYTVTADLLGNVPITPPPSTPLTIGDTINAEISVPGEMDRYIFTLNGPRTLSFDALSFSDVQWSLSGPDGFEVQNISVFSVDGSNDGVFVRSPLRLDAGSYQLTATSGGVASYSFRLLDLASATPIDLGATVSGELSPKTETDVFRFNVISPGRFFFDNRTAAVSGGPTAQLVLVNPQGFRILSTGFLSSGFPLDAEAVLTSPGTYTVLLEGELGSSSAGNYQFAVTALPNTPPTSIDFGQLVDTSISQPGEQDVYTFTLPQDGAIYMDAMTRDDAHLLYTLTGPLGTIVNSRDFSALESSFAFAKVQVNPFPAVAGQYTITVDGRGDSTPSYRFQVLNPAQQILSIPLETPIPGTLDPGSSSKLFRFDISQPGTYYFDNQTPPPQPPGENIWRLYDPFGNVVFSQDFDGNGLIDAEVKLPFAGSYTLLLEGNLSNQAPVPFEFSIRPTTANSIPLTLNQTITGNLAHAGDTDRYAFSLARDTLVYVDALTNDPQFAWSLEGPQALGPVRLAAFVEDTFARPFDHSEGADRNADSFEVFRLPAGDYVLTVDGASDHTGAYQFRLDDLAAAIPITLGTPFSGELSPPSETDLYRFEATAGDQMIVHSQAQSIATGAIYNLIDPYGQIVTPQNQFHHFVLGEDFGFTVPRTGTYTLLVEGRILDTRLVTHTFNVEPVATTTLSAPVTDTLSLDSLQNGQLEDLRSFKTLTFAGQAGQRLFFDGIQPGGSTAFRLVTPSGERFFGMVSRQSEVRRNGTLTFPVANRGPFTLPETGTYQLIVDDTEDSVGRRAPDALLGGAGFRPGALPIILAATDTGTAFQPDGIDPIVGAGGVSVPLSDFTSSSRSSTPQGRGASIQQTISALNSLGALVIGMGTNAEADSAPRRTLEAISRVTGAVNASTDTFENNSSDPIGPGDPLYYQIAIGRQIDGARTAQGIVAAILQSLQHLSFDIDIVPSDPSVRLENLSGIRAALRAGDTANFDVRFSGDGTPHSFDLLFVKAGTGVVLGSIPVRINANPYAYDVEATDPDGDTVVFSLTDPPAGASIDPLTGAISFIPGGPGLFPFTVEASDSRGGVARQEFSVTVNDGQPNQLPQFTSSPTIMTLVGQPYAYTAGATDPDGDPLSFFLTEAPDGMTINQSTGEITWTPAAAQLGANNVTIRVLDSHGGAATQSFQVTVATNSVQAPPRIVSTPPSTAEVGRLLRYDVSAIDPNLDPLQFDLPVKSPGMVIDPTGGTFVWRPTLDQLGTHDVILRVRDGRGGVELQSFQITVSLANTAPVITSQPTGLATANLPFVYQVRAQDAEDSALVYSLRSASPGMAIDPATGLFTWTPTTAQLGSALVTIVVTDPHGAEATQDVLITVDSDSANGPPVITSSPRLQTGLQTLYLYQFHATDPDGDPLSYSLTTAPTGMSINAAGVISWQPQSGQLGVNSVAVRVSDGRGGIAAQNFQIEVLSQPVNSPPEITSAAPTSATIQRAFIYDPTAVDANNDPLFWSLDAAPIGVSIDPESGSVRWTPAADQRGLQSIVLRVTDPLGGATTQTLSLDVRGTNIPPVFATAPLTRAAVDQLYSYAPRAFDRDGDIPTFRLTQAPQGMLIDGATGVITWTPTLDQVGVQDVTLVVEDGQGGSTRQLFRILVTETLNHPPTITTTPPTAGSIGFTYQYDANASDPDGDALSFAVLSPPQGMFIDFATGLLTWVPQPGQAGQHTIGVQVTDTFGAVADQTFTIDVSLEDHFPVLAGPPLTAVAAGQLYRFDVPASDPDGDPLSYHLDAGPTGMTIDALGRVLWQTTPADVGNHAVQITIADNRGAEIELDYAITVAVDQAAPRVTLAVSENPVNIGGTVAFRIRATDDIAVDSLRLTVGGTAVPLDRNGRGTFVANQAGLFDAIATVTDTSGNAATSRLSLQVRDPSDVNAPTVEITSPEDDAVVTTFTDIVGTVNDDNLVQYKLEIAAADDLFTEIGHGNTPVIDGLLGRFDPTLLENDSYTLRLTATDAGGNVSTAVQTISTTGNLKLGEFRMSFVDLSIPLSGIPITATRSYDSLKAADRGDLGFGWQLDIRDTRLQTSVRATGDEADGVFNPFRDRTHVSLTLPDGTRQGFTFEPRQRFNLFGLKLFRPEFVPDPGVTSRLTVDQFDLQRIGNAYFGMTVGGLAYNPADSAFGGRYTLTTRDGTAFEIDGITGNVRRITDRNANTLTYTDDGVFSSTGVHITLSRDVQGRITSVTDPAGNSIRYTYDAQGDLVSVTDRNGAVTRFIYSPSRPHFLEQIIDPLGRKGVRTDYDDQGRMIRITNGSGAAVDLIHSLAQSEESFVDALGNTTIYAYDARGNIVTVVDALGGVTRQTYDDDDNMLTETDPLGHTSAFTYDNRRNLLSDTDPLGDMARFTYNAFGQLVTATDPLGRTRTNAYDNAGNLLSSLDAAGGLSSFGYDGAGNLTSWKDPTGAAVSLSYNAAGQMMTYTDAEGVVSQTTRDSAGNILTDVHTLQTVDGPKTNAWSYSYDAEDRVENIGGPEGGVIQVHVDAAGQYRSVIDPIGNSWHFEYTDDGRPSDRIGPDGHTLHTEYDAAGRTIALVLPDGQRTEREYDPLGRIIATTNPDGSVSRSVYDAAGRRTEMIDPLGRVQRYTYDAAGRMIRGELPDGSTTTNVYDAAGQLLSTTDAEGKTTRYQYDSLGQVTQMLFADGSTMTTTYDADERVVSRTMPTGETWRYSYSPAGRLVSVIDPAGNTTTYGHDSQGSFNELTDARGGKSTQVLDTLGRITRQTLPEGQSQTTSYDALGHLVEQTDFAGQTTRYEYDNSGRLTRRINPDGTTETRSYDDNDTLINVTDVRGNTTLTRDVNGRITSFVGPSAVPVNYAFDAAGQVTSVNTDAGATRLAYSQRGNLAQLVDPAGETTSYVHDQLGRLIQTTLPNGFTIDHRYDELGRTTRITYSTPSGQTLYDLAYTRDNAGRIIRQEESTGRVVSYQYDILGRVTQEQRVEPGRPTTTITYGYDANGNLVQRTEGGITENLTYDLNDRLLSDGKFNYAWDANGNLISKSDGVTTESYAYDSQYRLIRMARTGSAPVTVTYQYDFDNLLASRTVNGVRTTFVWDRQSGPYPKLMEQRDAQGGLLVRYEHGSGALTEIHSAGGQTSFVVTDQLGTVRALAAADGSLQETLSFDAFGRLRDGALREDVGFTGDFTDPDSGLVYMQNRWYAPNLARFLSRDPVDGNPAFTNSLNRYAYSLDNPVNLSDPTGQFTLAEISTVLNIAGVLAGLAISHSPSAQALIADRLFHFGPLSFVNFTANVYPFASVSGNYGQVGASASVTGGFEMLHFQNFFPQAGMGSMGSDVAFFGYAGAGIQFGGSAAGVSVSLNLSQGYVFDARTPEDYTEWFVNVALSFSAVSQTSKNILKQIQEAGNPGGSILSFALPPPPSSSAGFMAFFSPTTHTDSQTGATVYANGFAPIGPSLSFGTPSAGMTAQLNVSLTYYWDLSYYVNYAASIVGPGVDAILNSILN